MYRDVAPPWPRSAHEIKTTKSHSGGGGQGEQTSRDKRAVSRVFIYDDFVVDTTHPHPAAATAAAAPGDDDNNYSLLFLSGTYANELEIKGNKSRGEPYCAAAD